MTQNFQRILAKMKEMLNVTFYKAAVFLLVGIVMFSLMYSNVKPKQLNIDVFTVAEETIRSPITIEDKYATEQKKEHRVLWKKMEMLPTMQLPPLGLVS